MPALNNPKHEQFAQAYAKGMSATQAYIAAGYSGKGADVSASRLLSNASVRARVSELQETIADRMIRHEIGRREHRVNVLQNILDRIMRVIDARAELLGDDPESGGGDTGLIVRSEKPGKHGTIVEYRADTPLIRELRATMQQAAQELGQWTERRDVDVKSDVQHSIDFSGLSDAELTRAVEAARNASEVIANLGSGAEAPEA